MRTAIVILSCAACATEGPICSADQLESALAAGGVVKIGSCKIEGKFVVPPGVTLSGAGATRSVIAGSVELRPGDVQPTRVESLAIESTDATALFAGGPGRAGAADVAIAYSGKLGLGARGLTSLELTRVAVNHAVAAALRDAQAAETPSYGLIIADVPDANLEDVRVEGATAIGAVFSASTVRWKRGGAFSSGVAGLAGDGGSTNLEDVELARNGGAGLIAYGAAFTGMAAVETTRLRIAENDDGYGLLQIGGSARHDNADISNNGEVGAHAEQMTSFELTGRVRGNGLAGVAIVESTGVLVHDAMIEMTRAVPTTSANGSGVVSIGDGIDLVRAADGAVLRDLAISGNERAGLLIELGGGTTAATTLERVQITVASTAQAAAVAQNGTAAMGWDSGVVRAGTTAANDAAFAGMLDPVEGIGPCDYQELTAGFTAARATLMP